MTRRIPVLTTIALGIGVVISGFAFCGPGIWIALYFALPYFALLTTAWHFGADETASRWVSIGSVAVVLPLLLLLTVIRPVVDGQASMGLELVDMVIPLLQLAALLPFAAFAWSTAAPPRSPAAAMLLMLFLGVPLGGGALLTVSGQFVETLFAFLYNGPTLRPPRVNPEAEARRAAFADLGYLDERTAAQRWLVEPGQFTDATGAVLRKRGNWTIASTTSNTSYGKGFAVLDLQVEGNYASDDSGPDQTYRGQAHFRIERNQEGRLLIVLVSLDAPMSIQNVVSIPVVVPPPVTNLRLRPSIAPPLTTEGADAALAQWLSRSGLLDSNLIKEPGGRATIGESKTGSFLILEADVVKGFAVWFTGVPYHNKQGESRQYTGPGEVTYRLGDGGRWGLTGVWLLNLPDECNPRKTWTAWAATAPDSIPVPD